MSWQATAWVSTVEAGGASGKLLLYALANYADEHGVCYPGDERLMRDTELSERAIRDWKRKLAEAGLMAIERRRVKGGTFDVDVIRLAMEPGEPPANSAGGEDAATTGKSRPNHRQMTPPPPANGAVPPTPPYKAEPSKEPPEEPEREGARGNSISQANPADAGPSDGAPDDRRASVDASASPEEAENNPEDTPGRADFEKRVMRFCNGRGFLTGPWPDWDTGAAPGWIARQFAGLCVEERAEAERWRDAYLLDMADRKKPPVAVGNFLKSRMWQALEPALLERLDKFREARLNPVDRAKPDGWAASLGPVGMAMLFARLLAEPEAAARVAALGSFFTDGGLREAWEWLWQWRAVLRQKGGAVFGERWHALKDAMEPVPAGTDVLAAWKAEFERRNWPWLVEFQRGEVVYCPKGGPDGLSEFEQALARMEAEGKASREAAE